MIKRHVKHKRGREAKDGTVLWKRPALHHFLKTAPKLDPEFVHIEEVVDEAPPIFGQTGVAPVESVLERLDKTGHKGRVAPHSAGKKGAVETSDDETRMAPNGAASPPLVFGRHSVELDFEAHLRALKTAKAPEPGGPAGVGRCAPLKGELFSEELEFKSHT